MEQKNNSWDHFFRNDSSNMLEDALPYLPSSLKKAAAIYIKLNELTNIQNEFDNEAALSACGLDQNNASLELLLNAMRQRAPKETAQQIDQMMQMMQMMKLYQSYQSFLKSNPSLASAPASNAENDFMSQLNKILNQ
jgi:predicted component of type VI protein secretion system